MWSKGARSFRGQNILEPGPPDALFSSKKVDDLLVVALITQKPSTPLRLFTVKIQLIKRSAVRYGNFFLIFCSHYYRSKVKR